MKYKGIFRNTIRVVYKTTLKNLWLKKVDYKDSG